MAAMTLAKEEVIHVAATARVVLMATIQVKGSREAAKATSIILGKVQGAKEANPAADSVEVARVVTRMDTPASSQDRAAEVKVMEINSPKEGEVMADLKITQGVMGDLAKEIPKDKLKINKIIIIIKVKEDNDVFLDQCYKF